VIGVTYLRFWSLLPRSETNDPCRYDLVPCRYVERKADTVNIAVSVSKDSKLRVVHAGWDDAKVAAQ
jgi:hypothetical protein